MKFDFNKKDKNIKYFVFVFAACFIFLFIILLGNSKKIKKIDVSKYKITEGSKYDIKYAINNNFKTYEIEGYCLPKEINIKKSKINLLIVNKYDEWNVVPTYVKYISENDSTLNNGWTGFKSIAEKKQLNIDGDYSLYLFVDFNDVIEIIDLNNKICVEQ